MTDPINTVDVGQTDYMKLFMQELTYQDPLKPVDNREFMTQMAQFSVLQQTAATNEKLDTLIQLYYGERALNLLSKKVTVANANGLGEVKAIRFTKDQTPEVRVAMDNDENTWINVEQIYETGEV